MRRLRIAFRQSSYRHAVRQQAQVQPIVREPVTAQTRSRRERTQQAGDAHF